MRRILIMFPLAIGIVLVACAIVYPEIGKMALLLSLPWFLMAGLFVDKTGG